MSGRPTERTDIARAWHRRAGDLAQSCAGSFADEEDERLDDLRGLLADAPLPLRAGLPSHGFAGSDAPRPGMAIAAVLALVEACRGGYMLSWGTDGGHLATVILPGAEGEATMSADSAGLALIGALAQALAECGESRSLASNRYLPDGAILN